MKNRLVALAGACCLLLVLTAGCSKAADPEFGTISTKEHDPGGTERVCKRKNGKKSCKNERKTEEWELKLTFDGKSFEDEVTEAQFEGAQEGDCWSTKADEVVDAARCEA
jgi:hypothetical protein